MRRILACLVFVVACADIPEPEPPTVWNVGWSCTYNCNSPPRPNNTNNGRLEIDNLRLTYTGSSIGEVHFASRVDADGCYQVPEFDEPDRTRRAYELCPRPAGQIGMQGDVSWTVALLTTEFSTWHADLSPQPSP